MCSCVQCAMQKKSVYCEALPCLANVESCRTETCPPPPRDSVYLQLPRRVNLDSVNLRAAQCGTFSCRTVYVHIVLYFSSSILSFGTPPKCFIRIVLIVVIFKF